MGEVMKKIAFLSLLILLISCASSNPLLTHSNRESLNRLEIGMLKSEVISIMGDPFQREAFLNEEQNEIQLERDSFSALSKRDNPGS